MPDPVSGVPLNPGALEAAAKALAASRDEGSYWKTYRDDAEVAVAAYLAVLDADGETEARTLTINFIQQQIREVAEDLLLNDSLEDPASEADKRWAALLAGRIADTWAAHRDATFADDLESGAGVPR